MKRSNFKNLIYKEINEQTQIQKNNPIKCHIGYWEALCLLK
jgi:hypothetical protein